MSSRPAAAESGRRAAIFREQPIRADPRRRRYSRSATRSTRGATAEQIPSATEGAWSRSSLRRRRFFRRSIVRFRFGFVFFDVTVGLDGALQRQLSAAGIADRTQGDIMHRENDDARQRGDSADERAELVIGADLALCA